MILVQDQYRQGSRKNYQTEFQLKQNSSKQLFSDPKEILRVNYGWKLNFPKEIWGISCEDDLFTSGNETEEEEEEEEEDDDGEDGEEDGDGAAGERESFFHDPDDYPGEELIGTERQPNSTCSGWRKSKSVRFENRNSFENGGLEISETSSLENGYPELNCGHEERRRSLSQGSAKAREHHHHHLRGSIQRKPKWRTTDCGEEKQERRPKSSPEKAASYLEGVTEARRLVGSAKYGEQIENRHRTRRKEQHRCGRIRGEINLDHVCNRGEIGCRKSSYKFDCGGDDFSRYHRHGDYHPAEEEQPEVEEEEEEEEGGGGGVGGRKKNHPKSKSVRKHFFCHGKDHPPDEGAVKGQRKKPCRPGQGKQMDPFGRFATPEHHHCQQEECHDRGKSKKKSILESVHENREKSIDSVCRFPRSKFSGQNLVQVPAESVGHTGGRLTEKMAMNSFHPGEWFRRSGRNFGGESHGMHKLRSRRTRMNRLKNGWKKAFVQTVRDGTRNERVGVLVMGPKGPEFYSKKSSETDGYEKGDPEAGSKSFEVMTVDCKNVYLSSSEPRTTTCVISDLACPERFRASFNISCCWHLRWRETNRTKSRLKTLERFHRFQMPAADVKCWHEKSGTKRCFAVLLRDSLQPKKDEAKVDAKLADFSKNVSKIVKTSEEKFYKSLSGNGYREKKKISDVFGKDKGKEEDEEEEEEEGKDEEANEEEEHEEAKERAKDIEKEGTTVVEEEEKVQGLRLLPFESISSPAGTKKRERKINRESRLTAEALNKRAKEFRESQSDPKAREDNFYESLKQLQERFPAREISEDEAKANLSLWGIKPDCLTGEERRDRFGGRKDRGDGNGEEEKMEEEREKVEMGSEKEEGKSMGSQRRNEKCRERERDQESARLKKIEDGRRRKESKVTNPATKWTQSMSGERESVKGMNGKESERKMISKMFRDLVENGCAISQEESEDLQNLYSRASADENQNDGNGNDNNNNNNNNNNRNNNDFVSEISSGEIGIGLDESKENGSPPSTIEEIKGKEKNCEDLSAKKKMEEEKEDGGDPDGREREDRSGNARLEESDLRKMFKPKTRLDGKTFRGIRNKSEETKKKMDPEEKTKLLREALPSIAAENEAAHLKQLKRYIDRFIERVEASASSDHQKPVQKNRSGSKESIATDNSSSSSRSSSREVRVDARKILDIVNSPFKTISSDVTINIAKKLTDALVQEKTCKGEARRRIRLASGGNRKKKKKKNNNNRSEEPETDEDGFPLRLGPAANSGSGKLPTERVRLRVEAILGGANSLAVFACGFLGACGLLLLVKKCK